MPSEKIRAMAGTDARTDGNGGGGGVAAAGRGGAIATATAAPSPAPPAAAPSGADIREPLRSLYQNSSNDPGVQDPLGKSSPILSKIPQPYRPFVFGSSRSASSRSVSPDAEDVRHHQQPGAAAAGGGGGGGLAAAREAGSTERLRMSSSSHRSHPGGGGAAAEEELQQDHHHQQKLQQTSSEYSEIQNCMDDGGSTPRSPMSMSEGSQSYGHSCFSDSQLITDVEDNENLMQLKLEAMTWAAMAKDFTISSLEKRLRKALQIAKAEQAKNLELQTQLDDSRQELSKAKEDVAKLEEAEERLCRERGDIEVDATQFAAERAKLAAEQSKQHRSQLLMLEHRIKLMLGERAKSVHPLGQGQRQGQRGQDRQLERSFSSQSGDWQSSDVQILEQALEQAQEKILEAEQEIEELRREVSDANTDLRVSEVLRKTQSRRLKALEKERRYLLRKGALRAVKLAPRTQRKCEPTLPGGPGWNVFSVLEYAES
ncbi:hypothetical protein Mapa_005157 [Marchantia paleacea]|nr:hypothetical protein Mapa_005157 [Marchantia paleacea]